MQAVIMAGGKGTRIRSVASDIPKPMIPAEGKPILLWQIENLKRCGVRDIILVTGYLSRSIKDYFGDGADLGVNISYFDEERPMGTAGSLFLFKERLEDDFILVMGDLMLSVDFNRFMAAHRASDALITLFVHPNSHPQDSDIIVTEDDTDTADYTEDKCGRDVPFDIGDKALSVRVTGFIGKNDERDYYYHNQVNAGVYALSRKVLDEVNVPDGGKTDLDKDIVRPLIPEGRIFAYRSAEYVKDMGTPERYAEVTGAVRSGLFEKRNLTNPQKCVFLDRDGTINKEKGFINNPGEIELYDGAAEAVKMLNDSEYLCVLVTNQPVIARGEADFETYFEMQKCIEDKLGERGAYLDGMFFCPHHKDSGFEGEVRELKFNCRCRKPEPGMLYEAAARLNIDLSDSYMIGDSTADILCGRNAGTKTVAVMTGNAIKDGRYDAVPDMTAADILEAVKLILGKDS